MESRDVQEALDVILEKVNVESKDDGVKFFVTTRKNNIKDLLKDSAYNVISETGLSLIYAKEDYANQTGLILISCHIDSVYTEHFQSKYSEQELLGTFDNSICNALILMLMLENSLSSSVVVSFTGGEEDCHGKFRGAAETFQYFSKQKQPELIITLDVTGEGYGSESFTIENYFASKNKQSCPKLLFNSNEDFRVYLEAILKYPFLSIENAWPDESHYYMKQDLNCFSLCIPTAPVVDTAEWMHSDNGILVQDKSLSEYSQALKKLTNSIAEKTNSNRDYTKNQ